MSFMRVLVVVEDVLVVLAVAIVLVVMAGAVVVEPTTDVDVEPAAIGPIVGSEVAAHALTTSAPSTTKNPAPRHRRRVSCTITSVLTNGQSLVSTVVFGAHSRARRSTGNPSGWATRPQSAVRRRPAVTASP
jgi:hypothetical protein